MTALSATVGQYQPIELHLDLETRSAADLKRTGLYVYAEHPTTDVWCACWSINDEPVQTWLPGDPFPAAFAAALEQGAVVYAHNAGFEHALWSMVLTPRYGWPAIGFDRFRCTAAMAAAMALPRDLAGAAIAMGLPEQKDMTGKRLMLQLAKPRRVEPDGTPRWWEPADVPEKFKRLYEYCVQDVEVERALTKRLRPLSPAEHAIWQLDHEINTRGVGVDLTSVAHADAIVKATLARLNQEIAVRTRNAVTGVNQAARLTEWLQKEGVDIEKVDKAAIRSALAGPPLPSNVERVLEIRQEAAKSSTAKLEAMRLRTSADGRTRETLMYHGASTGRWSGKGIQLQNLPRPSLKSGAIDAAIDTFQSRDPAWLEVFGPPLSVVSDCLRGLIVAGEGRELMRADFSNIEGRVLAWLAGQQDKLDAFRAYDTITGQDSRGKPVRAGPDLYIVAAAGMYGVPADSIDAEDPRRQVGKVSELALGYQGGHGAFISMGANYNIAPSDIAPAVKAAFSDEIWAAAAARYEEKNRYDLPEDEWTALRIVVDSWRAAYPSIVQLWADLEDAAWSAVANPGRSFKAGFVQYACQGNILWCRLPSGRLLSYVDPKIKEIETPWGSKKDAVTYMGVNSVTRKWERSKAYGGHFAENVTQAVARDIMAEAMLRVEARGWPIVLSVHDEVVAEVAEGSVELADFVAEMEVLPSWAHGLPVSAAGAAGRRYGK